MIKIVSFFFLFDFLFQEIPLYNGSDSMARWLKVKSPFGMEFIIFHVVNSDAVSAGVEKPILIEKGPYFFDEIREKEATSFRDDGNLIVYNNYKKYYFNQQKSFGSLEDKVIIPNVPAIVSSRLVY